MEIRNVKRYKVNCELFVLLLRENVQYFSARIPNERSTLKYLFRKCIDEDKVCDKGDKR